MFVIFSTKRGNGVQDTVAMYQIIRSLRMLICHPKGYYIYGHSSEWYIVSETTVTDYHSVPQYKNRFHVTFKYKRCLHFGTECYLVLLLSLPSDSTSSVVQHHSINIDHS